MKQNSYIIKKSTLRLMYSLLALVLVSVFICCGGGGNSDDATTNPNYDEIQELQYHFGDSSVPPEYHRSYTITISTDMVNIVVDSYGDILANENYDITNEQFNDIISSMRNNDIRNCELGEDDSCVGGTSESFTGSGAEGIIFDGEVYHCGGDDFGDLCGDVANFANDVRNLIPNLTELLQ